MTASENITYQIDTDDRIVSVNDAWDRFAQENEGGDSESAKVLNRRIWDFISDSETLAFYDRAIELARRGDSVTFRFSCDSPRFRRSLEMVIETVDNGLVEFRSKTLSIESRKPEIVFEAAIPRTSELLLVCSWCKKVFINGGWLDAEVAGISNRAELPTLTHGICEVCYEIVSGSPSP